MIEAPEIIFSDESHEYTVDGVIRPSVTRILGDLGFTSFNGVAPHVLEAARIRGSDVHYGVNAVEDDIRHYDELDDGIVPYVDAYLAMKADTGWHPLHREKIVYEPTFNYAGTLDGFGSMSRLGFEEVLPDYKSGIAQRAAAFQTAAYALGLKKPAASRCSIHLRGNGTYKVIWHRDRNDVRGWMAIVTTYHLKHNGRG